MASSTQILGTNWRGRLERMGGIILGDTAGLPSTTDVAIVAGTGAPSGAYWLAAYSILVALYIQEDAATADAALWRTIDGGTTWTQSTTLVDLELSAATAVTVATGAVTLTQGIHTVTGEGAALDDVDTISGLSDAEIAVLVTGAFAITYRDAAVGGGNIALDGDTSLVTATGDVVMAVRSGSVIRVVPIVMTAGRPVGSLALSRGYLIVGDSSDQGSPLDLGAAQGIPYSDGTDVQRGTIQADGTGATGSTAATISMGGDTASGTASISVGGSTASDGAVAGASGTASISVGGSTASDGAVASASATAAITMGGDTAAGGTDATGGTAPAATESAPIFHWMTLTNPATAGTNVLAQKAVDFDETTWANLTQPDVPRGIQCVFAAAWDGGNIEITGVRADGTTTVETVTAVGAGTVPGVEGWIRIRRVRNLGTRLNGTVDVQYSGLLALQNVGGRTATLVDAYEDSAGGRITDSAITAELWDPGPTYPPNGVRDYTVAYTVAATYSVASHTHTGPSHTHGATGLTATDAGHTHTGGAHTHGATGLTATDAGHTHTGGAHTHGATGLTATDAGHTHGATGLTATDGGHTHTGPSHTHTIA